ncbi:CGNR zinc finger domain-containing protein [Nonomuraea rhizosphaerae]|uniref:CGNR zinc finger domain-containing protein n=1 Tax=Nonomuraea rhizosphaerae TaxID=2665663 RepID=UPI0027E313F6|nr:CGNR zinc finger domain-containing protein [Nonomuraea rhizosphaerae]
MKNYLFVSGDLALDLVGTLQHRRSDRRELLLDPADLAGWTAEAGILDAPPAVDARGLEAGKALREAVYRLASGSGLPEDRALVNRVAAGPPVSVRLTGGGGVERAGDLDAVLSTVARAAVELLGGTRVVKECEGEECTRLYVDTSRGSVRRWCDMEQCGNRAKAAGFRARRARSATR